MKRLSLFAMALVFASGAWIETALAADEFNEFDRQAIFSAAGFKKKDDAYTRCEDPSPSHMPGYLEPADLNNDGRPEVFVRESSTSCYGGTEQAFVLVTKTPSGAWLVILDQVGVPTALETKSNGWADIEVGGPGGGPFPVYKYDGMQYVGP